MGEAMETLRAALRIEHGPTEAPRAAAGGGIGAGTLVLTMQGALPIEHLCAGDMVITRSGSRPLLGVTVRHARRVVVLPARALSHGAPEEPLVLGVAQPVRLAGHTASALHAPRPAMRPAARLAPSRAAPAETRLFDLVFDAAQIIYAGGAELIAGTGALPCWDMTEALLADPS